MSTLQNLAKETVIYGMSHVLPRILHFGVMTIYLTHRFTDNINYGIYSELYAYATIILAFMVFRMDTAYFRFGSTAKDKDAVFTTVMTPVALIALVVSGTMVLFSEQIAVLLSYPDQGYYVTWFAGILGLDAISAIVYAKFRLENRPFRFLFFRVSNVVITVVLVLFFLEIVPRLDPGLTERWMLTLGLKRELDFVFLSNLLASISVAIMMLPEIVRMKFKVSKSLLLEVFKYSWPLVIVALAGSINQSSAMILQKYWLPGSLEENQAMVGIFSAGAKLAILLNLFTTAFNYAAEPFFFNNAARKDDKSIYGDVALAYTIFASITVLGTYLFIDVVMGLIGSTYREGVIVVPVLLIAFMFLGLYYMVAIWYKLSNKTKIGAIVSLVGVVITLGINFLTLPKFGIIGSAWASLMCYSFMVFICYQWGKKYYPIVYPWKRILLIILITATIVFVSNQLRNYFYTETMLLYGINIILFIVGLFILYLLESKFVKNIIKNR